MATELNWTNKSPAYKQAVEDFACVCYGFMTAEHYDHSQANSLLTTLAVDSTSTLLDSAVYLDQQMNPSDKQLVTEVQAIAFIDVQTERFKWLLEDQISSDYNIPTKLLRSNRRLDA